MKKRRLQEVGSNRGRIWLIQLEKEVRKGFLDKADRQVTHKRWHEDQLWSTLGFH